MARRCYCILKNFQPILLFTDVVRTSIYCMKYMKWAGKLYNDSIISITRYRHFSGISILYKQNGYFRFEINIVWISIYC